MAREKGLPRCWGGWQRARTHARTCARARGHKLCAPKRVRTPPDSDIGLFWGHIFGGAKRNGDPTGQEGEI